jgi:hypothetical protein
MADIAKLFLDGARPGHNGAPAPRRVAPQAASQEPAGPAAPPPPAAPAATRARSTLREEVPARRPAPRQSVMMALGLPSSSHSSWRLLSDAAAGLSAEQATTVGLIGMQLDRSGRPQIVLDVHGVESADDLPAMRPMAGVLDLQLAQTLFTLGPAIGLWLVAAPEPESPAFAAIAARLSEWLLVSPTDNEGIVAGYQHFKKSWVLAERTTDHPQRPARVPSVFLLTADESHAAVVHGRMRKAAQEFLKTDLKLAGIIPPGAGDDALRLLTLPASAGALPALWSCILDELCPVDSLGAEHPEAHEPVPASRVIAPTEAHPIEDVLDQISSNAEDVARHSAAAAGMVLDHLAQVLDPEEREALSAGFDDDEPEMPALEPAPVARPAAQASPAYDIRTLVVPPAQTPAPRPAPPVAPVTARPPAAPAIPCTAAPAGPAAPVGVTLRAFDVIDARDESRSSQWDAVERSVRDLVPGSILLEARPPMSWASESCIAIDPEGRLHVWTLYKDGASWFALREWANEHRDLLALTRRDLVLSKEAQVAVHIVLSLDAVPDRPGEANEKSPGVVSTILRTPVKNIHLYRLRVLQWNARRGLLVVPLA